VIGFEFHPEALAEFKAEVEYYNAIERSLGVDFAAEITRVIDQARVFPNIGSPDEGNVRSLLARRFPFLVYYEIIGDKLWIWAVMHAAREPGYWKSRREN
jgi:toxin ParE1/3/4